MWFSLYGLFFVSMVPLSSFLRPQPFANSKCGTGQLRELPHPWDCQFGSLHDAAQCSERRWPCPLLIAIVGSGFLFGDFVVGHLGVLQISAPKMEIWLAD